MKILQLALLLVLSTATFISCKKDKDEPVFVFEGTWTGKLGTGDAVPASQFEINVKPGGVIERININGNVAGTGNWALVSNEFAATYVLSGGTQIVLNGDFDPSTKKLAGTWSNSAGDTGKWNAAHD